MQKPAPEMVHEFLGNFFGRRGRGEKNSPRIKSHPPRRGRWTHADIF